MLIGLMARRAARAERRGEDTYTETTWKKTKPTPLKDDDKAASVKQELVSPVLIVAC